MIRRQWFSRLAVLAVVALGLAAQEARAVQVTFAQFTQAVAGRRFTFKNAGAGSTFFTNDASGSLTPGSVPVNFQVLDNALNPANNGMTIAANLTVNATVTSPATQSGSNINQPLGGTLSFIGAAGSGFDGQNLLTVTFAPGPPPDQASINGRVNSNSSSLNADTAIGDTITYTSSIFRPEVTASLIKDLSMAFSSTVPPLAIVNNYLRSFTASGSGSFSANVVPEPATLALAGLGIPFALVALRRRRSAR